ncbi:hypothetical protein LLH23_16790 [bacterium]|nr:hypothetical protein [bacterium]
MDSGLTLRPFHLLCLFCRCAGDIPPPQRDTVAQAADAIRQRPDLPVTLRCLARDVYAYQDVDVGARASQPANGGSGLESPRSSVESERKRDLDILYRLDLPPGATLPARTLLHRVRKAISTTAGLCGCEGAASAAWQGCPLALSEQYERGVALPLESLVPARTADEMARDKAASVAAMEGGEALRIRPHVMMCAVCNYGKNEGRAEPLAADNIVEFIEIIRRKPDDVAVVMAPGADWMICAPCPHRVPGMNACVNVAGSGGLSNEKRDLDLLRLLDLQYEDALPAREMLRLLFSRVPSTMAVCRRESPELSVWWDGCGVANCTAGNAGYEAGRKLLMAELDL